MNTMHLCHRASIFTAESSPEQTMAYTADVDAVRKSSPHHTASLFAPDAARLAAARATIVSIEDAMGRRQAACHLRMDTDGRAYVGGLVRLAGGSHAAPGLAVALAIDFGVDRGVKIFGAAVRVFPKGLFHDRHGIPLKENSASLNLLMNTFRFKADRIASVLIRRDAEDIDMSASAESDGVSYRIRVLRSTRCTVAVARALAMLHAERRI